MRILRAIGWLALGVVGCGGGGSAPDGTACTAAPGSVATLGLSTNGLSTNGLSTNGMSTNGLSTNGLSTNGMSTNGLSTNGTWLRGLAAGSIRADGIVVGDEARLAQSVAAGSSVGMLVGTELVLQSGPDVVRGAALQGADVIARDASGPIDVHIDEVAAAGALTTYRLSINGVAVCGGTGFGTFLQGAWDERAARVSDTAVSFSCNDGALAKCVHLGYQPWTAGAAIHQACVRMLRADYCGDGVSWTRNGTLVDVFDAKGIQTASNPVGFSFEAGWGENGATCVSRTRYELRGPDGSQLVPGCWGALPKCSDGGAALLSNASATADHVMTLCR